MPTGPLTVLSQSSLQDYADCPRRFKLRYTDRLNYPSLESEPALENEKNKQEGEYFHRLVQQSLLGLDQDRLRHLANSADLARWWQNFLDFHPALDGYTIYTEHTLAAPLGPVRLVAKYDLIAVRQGEAVIYDWKTYRKRPQDEWLAVRWQTRVYMALLARSGSCLNGGQELLPENIRMLYWFADFPTEPASFAYSAEQLQRDWEALLLLAEEMPGAPDYPQTDDLRKCTYCIYRSYCDRGGRAPEGFDVETEIDTRDSFDLNFEQIGEIAF